MKHCPKCRQDKPISDFGLHSRMPDGKRRNCKLCEQQPARDSVCAACGQAWRYRDRGFVPRLCPACQGSKSWCNGCLTAKPHSEFYAFKRSRTGRQGHCKQCIATRNKQPARARVRQEIHRRLTYGMTEGEFDAITARQGGRCAICGKVKSLVVDHDHTSGRVRGLVCFGCNTGLGKMQDSPDGLHRAEIYLWSSRDVLSELAAGLL